MLWACLAKDFPAEDETFRASHRATLERLNGLERPSPDEEVAVTVPHLMPFLSGCKDFKERRSFRIIFAEVFGDDAQVPVELDKHVGFQAHIAQVQLYLGQGQSWVISLMQNLTLTVPGIKKFLPVR